MFGFRKEVHLVETREINEINGNQQGNDKIKHSHSRCFLFNCHKCILGVNKSSGGRRRTKCNGHLMVIKHACYYEMNQKIIMQQYIITIL